MTHPVPDPPIDQTPAQTIRRPGLGYRLSEAVGMIPLLAPLAAAGWYQADLAHEVFGWTYPWALVWPAAIEGGAAYAASLYLRKLVAGHSTVSTRIGMVCYAVASSLLLWWHAIDGGKPWQAAAGIGGMTLAAVWIWGQRSRWLRRADLQAKGLVDAQAPRFSLLRWLMCPLETPQAFRHAVKLGISDPQTALEVYRSDRTRRRTGRALARARRRTPQQTPDRAAPATAASGSRQTSGERQDQTPTSGRTQTGRTRRRQTRTRPARLRSTDDDQTLARLRAAFPDRSRTPSLSEIQQTAGGGRTRAIRLRGLLAEQSGDDDQEGSSWAV